MKISLAIEADSAEDFASALAVLVGAAAPKMPSTGWARVKEVAEVLDSIREEAGTEAGKPEPVAAEPAVADAAQAAPAVQEAPAEARVSRGRPRKKTAGAAAAAVAPADQVSPVPAETGAAAGAPAATAVKAEAKATPVLVATRDALMETFASYVQRYGTGFGYADVSRLLQDTFGNGVRKSSDVSDDNLAQAVAVVHAAIEGNPFNRKRADVQ